MLHRRHPLADETRITPISFLLNVLWLVCGGAATALGWFVAAFLMAITIIGLPWAQAAWNNGVFTLWPFGVTPLRRSLVDPVSLGPLAFLGNLIWLILAGWWLAAAHVAIALLLAVTLFGLPFAWAHLKLAGFALWPIGRVLVRA